MSDRFDERGRLIIPEPPGPSRPLKSGERLVVPAVYCPYGHNLVDEHHRVGGEPGIRIGFRDPRGTEGVVVLSPVLGCLDKVVLHGRLVEDEQLELMCPVCRRPLPVLTSCPCRQGAVRNVLFLNPDRDVNNAIAFCNVVGCPNSSLTHSGEIIRAAQIEGL